jgi:hypothetical protein
VVELANPLTVRRASRREAVAVRSQGVSAERGTLTALANIAIEPWHALGQRAVEPNGYYLPGWALAIDASARGRTNVSALSAWSDAGLIGRDGG